MRLVDSCLIYDPQQNIPPLESVYWKTFHPLPSGLHATGNRALWRLSACRQSGSRCAAVVLRYDFAGVYQIGEV